MHIRAMGSLGRPGGPQRSRRSPNLVVGLAFSLAALLATVPAAEGGEPCHFIRGDVNTEHGAGVVDLNDGVDILAFLFLGVSAPSCPDAADVNDNGLVELSDYTYLVNFLFNGGPAPPAPFPDPGADPTAGVSVPAERDARFRFALGSAMGVPSNTGIQVPVTLSNEVGITALQMVLRYNTRDPECPDLLISEIRTEEGTLLSGESAEYIIAEFDNVEGVAFVAAIKDFATPFWFHVGSDPELPAGEDQLVATIVLGIASCARRGVTSLEFTDGISIPNADVMPPLDNPPREAHNLVMLGDSAVRPQLANGSVDVRAGFIRGDANGDRRADLSDPIFALGFIFRGTREPPCMDAADANNDTRVDISDAVFLLNYLFRGGPQPSEPFPQAGVDPSDDGRGSLGCASDA